MLETLAIKPEIKEQIIVAQKTKAEKLRALKQMVDTVALRFFNSLMVPGPSGHGKTHEISRMLQGINDVVYAPIHNSPLSLYKFFYLNRDKIIVADDSADTLLSRQNQAMLKAAMWGHPISRVRTLSWNSKQSVLENEELPKINGKEDTLPPSFEFKGQLILIYNPTRITINEHVAAIESRNLTYPYSLSFAEILATMVEMAENSEKLFKIEATDTGLILEWLISNANPATRNFDLRVFPKAVAMFLNDRLNWKIGMGAILDIDPRYTLMENVLTCFPLPTYSVDQQIQVFSKFADKMGLGSSRSTFFELRKKWFPTLVPQDFTVELKELAAAQKVDSNEPTNAPVVTGTVTGKKRGRKSKKDKLLEQQASLGAVSTTQSVSPAQ